MKFIFAYCSIGNQNFHFICHPFSSTWLHVWSPNGDPLAIVNTSVGSADRMQQILCVAFSSTREWDQQNVIITGSTDGVVRMWSMEYVQVPIADETVEEQSTTEEKKSTKKVDLIKQMSISTTDGNELQKSGSESSISEACDSVKETTKRFESERDDCSDKEETVKAQSATGSELEVPKCAMGKRGSLTSAKSLHELKHEPSIDKEKKNQRCSAHNEINEDCAKCKSDVSRAADDDETVKGRGIRPSKSDTSLTDSFVVIDSEYNKKKNQNLLRDGKWKCGNEAVDKQNFLSPFSLFAGFKWQRQLVFRSKLTMHTAYDRKDNTEPASITALAVSKDHKTLYVGDARGRVFSWSVTEQPGRGMADHWLKDEGADQCVGCHVK